MSTTPTEHEDDVPDLSALSDEEYAELLADVDDIAQQATDETGH